MRRAVRVELSGVERGELERWTTDLGVGSRVALRARIVLEASRGETNAHIAQHFHVHPETVARWRHRFAVNRLDGLTRDAPRTTARSAALVDLEARIVRMAREAPPSGRPRWTTRSLARALRVSHMLVHRVWKANGFENGPALPATEGGRARVQVDVVGLHLHAPAAAIVFSVVADSSGTPTTRPAVAPPTSGGYLVSDRHGEPAALVSVLARAEELIRRVPDTVRAPHELLVFLRTVDERTDPAASLYVLFDRPLAFVSDRVADWLRTHRRVHVEVTAPGGSWTAEIDRWFRQWTDSPLQGRSLAGVASLIESVARTVGSDSAPTCGFSWILAAAPPASLPERTPRPPSGRRPRESVEALPPPGMDRLASPG